MYIEKSVYPFGKKKCLTFSYDDNRNKANVRLVELFKKYNMKATFNINGGRLADENQRNSEEAYNLLFKNDLAKTFEGFEVACHGFNHPHYCYMDNVQMTNDIIKDRFMLEGLLKKPIRGLALPSGSYKEDQKQVLKACGIVYSRTTKFTNGFDVPTDFLEWNPTVKHDNFEKLFELGKQYLGSSWKLTAFLSCMNVMGHAWELDSIKGGWEKLEEFLSMMANNDDIWYASNIELYDYITALDNLIMTADGNCVINPSLVDVYVKADGEVVKIAAGETKMFN